MTEQNSVAEAVNNPLIPHLYVNGFNSVAGAFDITIGLQHNDKVVATINMGYGLAKTFMQMLAGNVDGFEKTTGVSAVSFAEFQRAVAMQQPSAETAN